MTLFPYTTLFRSLTTKRGHPMPCRNGGESVHPTMNEEHGLKADFPEIID
jgi:hypothetical protein